jgi:hypothetical protein
MNLRRAHPGGFVVSLERVDRDTTLRRIAAAVGRMLVLAPTDASAKRMAERLTLSGVPVLLAVGAGRPDAVEQFVGDGVSSLVTTADYLDEHGQVSAPIVIHTRVAPTAREYGRRVELAPSSVHVTFVVPEDEALADSLLPDLGEPIGVGVDNGDLLAPILEQVDASGTVAFSRRRRFPLAR